MAPARGPPRYKVGHYLQRGKGVQRLERREEAQESVCFEGRKVKP